jgi:uncharacterized protein (TIGR03437 family)
VLRGLSLVVLLSASGAFSGTVQSLAPLPNGATANAVQVDTSGNIYIAGAFGSNPASPQHAFIGKLSPDGSRVLWWTVLAGSNNDVVEAIALGSDNSVYAVGSTASLDFPTTAGSMQPTTTSTTDAGFAVKLNPSGAVVYSTYIGGTAATTGGAVTVDSAGDAFITGYVSSAGVIPTTPGAVAGGLSLGDNGFIIELNPAGAAALLAIQGFGGSAIAVDPQGNIYAAGAYAGPTPPTTLGAFQTTVSNAVCFSSFIMVSFCGYQHIAKVNATGTKLIYATYVAGSYGASPAGMAIDADGNVIVAGTTNSPDYPTTPGAYQAEYFSNPELALNVHEELAPAPAGYVTKLNASGTGLIWSTLFSGSSTQSTLPVVDLVSPGGDSITGMRIDTNGNILIAGIAQSSDLPGLWLTPVAARPTANGETFVARLSADGTTLSPTQLVPGSNASAGIAVRGDGSAVIVPALASVSLSSVGRVAAISDTADNAKIVRVAPGQLLTLYGTNLAPDTPAAFRIGTNGLVTSLDGVTVTFNGIPAPILYTSGIQINLQVPYEIAALGQVTMQVSSSMVAPPVSESYILAVAVRQPSVFISSNASSQPLFDLTACNGQNVSGLPPLALNADGTQNSCANPAASGSVVTIFLNGLGLTTPTLSTGAISDFVVALNPAAGMVNAGDALADFLSTATLPGSIDSIAQVQIQVSATSPYMSIPLAVQQGYGEGYWVRGPAILIWVK